MFRMVDVNSLIQNSISEFGGESVTINTSNITESFRLNSLQINF